MKQVTKPPSVDHPRIGDAFGHMLQRTHEAGGRSGAAYEVVERDDGTVSVRDASIYFDPIEQWPPTEVAALQWVRGSVLDIGVGAGRHALELGRRGHDVVGLDSSPGAVAVAEALGVSTTLGSLGGDAPLPVKSHAFDTVVLLGNNLGLLESPQKAPFILGQLREVLAMGGAIVASGVDPTVRPAAADWAYMRRNVARGRMAGQYRVRVRVGALASEWFDYLYLTPKELSELLSGSGGWTISHLERRGPWYSVRIVPPEETTVASLK